MLFASELYTDIMMQSILYKSVKSLTYILFSDSSSQMSLLNSSCHVIMFFHKKYIIINNVVYVNACASIQSERFSQITTI